MTDLSGGNGQSQNDRLLHSICCSSGQQGNPAMPPKVLKVKAKTKSVIVSSSKAKKKRHKDAVDAWANLPQCECNSCKQKTSTIDRDSPPGRKIYLKWVRTRKSKKFTKAIPAGGECYPCFFVRRKFPKEDKTMRTRDELTELRKKTEVDAEFWKRRADCVQGTKIYKAEGAVQVHALLEKSKEVYDDRHVTGTFHPIHEFAAERHLKYKTEDDLVELIKTKYPFYDVVIDEDECLGVEVKDLTGGKYKFQRGAKDKSAFKKVESIADVRDAKEIFQVTKAAKEVKLGLRSAGIVSEDEGYHDDAAVDDASMVEEQETEEAKELTENQPKKQLKPPTSESGRSTRAPSNNGSDRSRGTSDSKGSNGRSSSCSASTVTAGGEDESDGDGLCGRDYKVLKDAMASLRSIEKAWTPDLHFKKQKAHKLMEQETRRLREWGNKCGGKKDKDEKYASLSQILFDFADDLDERRLFFDASRKHPRKFVLQDVTPTGNWMFWQFSEKTKAAFVCQLSSRLADSALTDREASVAFVGALTATRYGSCAGIGLHASSDLDLTKHTQRSLFLGQCEKVLKIQSLEAFHVAASNLACQVYDKEATDGVSSVLDGLSDDALDGNKFINGWVPELWLDIVCIYLQSRAAAALPGGGEMPKSLYPLAQRVVALTFRLSARVRFVLMTGSTPPSMDTWRLVKAFSETQMAERPDLKPEVVKAWAAALAAGAAKDLPYGNDNAIATLFDEHEDDLIALGDYMSKCGIDDQGEALFTEGRQLRDALMASWSKLLTATDYHSELFQPPTADHHDDDDDSETETRTTRDAEYWKNLENLPDEISRVNTSTWLAVIMCHYPADSKEKMQTVKDVKALMLTYMDFWKSSRYEEGPALESFRRLAAIYRRLVGHNVGQSGPFSDSDHFVKLQSFLDQATRSTMIPKYLCSLLENCVSAGGRDNKAVLRESCLLQTALPPEANKFIAAGRALEYMEEVAGRIKNCRGGSPTVLELNDAMAAVNTAVMTVPSLKGTRVGFQPAVDLIAACAATGNTAPTASTVRKAKKMKTF